MPDDGATADTELTAWMPSAAGEGRVVAQYRLLQRIGEGGMGEVWEAEQTEPVQRRVALKLIKPGMDSAEVLARFESERQALALMDHSAIAKVFDAGTTENGRPFFAMEHVSWCADHRLLRSTAHVGTRAPGALHPGLWRDPARSSEGHHPP